MSEYADSKKQRDELYTWAYVDPDRPVAKKRGFFGRLFRK